MLSFESDYTEGAHEAILKRLVETNREQTPGYGADRGNLSLPLEQGLSGGCVFSGGPQRVEVRGDERICGIFPRENYERAVYPLKYECMIGRMTLETVPIPIFQKI